MKGQSTDYEINYLSKTRPYINRYIQKYKNVNIFDKNFGREVWDGIWDEMVKAQNYLPFEKHQPQEHFQLLHRYEYLFFLRYLFWVQKGRNIFQYSDALIEMLENTDVEQIEFEQIKLPYKSFYISLVEKDIFLYPDEEGRDVFANGALITQAKDKEIDVFFLGRIKDEAAYKNRKWFFHPEYKVGYTLEFDADKTTIKDALTNFQNKLQSNYDKSGVDQRMEVLLSNIRLVVNCICYLSLENKDIIKDYPTDVPTHLIERLKRGTTRHKKEKAETEISQAGFTKINFCGQKYKNNPDLNSLNISGIKPHWRRGHYRNQVHGEGNLLRKMIWIEPTIVNKSLGDPEKGHIYNVEKENKNG